MKPSKNRVYKRVPFWPWQRRTGSKSIPSDVSTAHSHCFGKERLLIDDLLPEHVVEQRVPMAVHGGEIWKSRKLHKFESVGKARVGEKSANAGETGEYLAFPFCQFSGSWGNVFENVKVDLVRNNGQSATRAASLWSWRKRRISET